MIIAHVTSNLSTHVGGAESYAIELALEQASTGKKVLVITSAVSPSVESRLSQGGVRVITIKRWRPYPPGSKGSSFIHKCVFHLLDIIDSLFQRDISDVLAREHVDLVHWHRFQGIGINSQKNLKTCAVATVHDHALLDTSSLALEKEPTLASRVRLLILNYLLRDFSLLVFPTEKVRDAHSKAGLRLANSTKSEVLGHGWKIPDRPIQIRREEPQEFKVRFLYLGALTEQKGISLLLDAWERKANTNSILTIAGSGPMSAIIQERKLGNVRLVGWIEGEHKSKLLLEHHAIIIPSQTPEVFCLVAAEACISGVAVICSDLAKPPYLVDKESCFEFRSGDLRHLQALLEDCEQHPLKLEALANQARLHSSGLDFREHQATLASQYEKALAHAKNGS